jgi:hypothetical protein
MTNVLAYAPPIGHADIAPTRFERIEGDGYLTLDAPWIVPALLRSVPIRGRVLEPAASRGQPRPHLARIEGGHAARSSRLTSEPMRVRSSPTSGSAISASSNRSPDSLGW